MHEIPLILFVRGSSGRVLPKAFGVDGLDRVDPLVIESLIWVTMGGELPDAPVAWVR